MSDSYLMNLTVMELQEKLRERGLSKDDLVSRLIEAGQGGNEKETNEKLLKVTQRGTEEKANMDEVMDGAESLAGTENSKNKADIEKKATGDAKDGEASSQKACSRNCLPGDSACPNRRFGKPLHHTISCLEVERLLAMLGVNPEHASNCIKAAIMRGHIRISGEEGELEMVVHQEVGPCGDMIQAKLGDLLRQPDYAGLDYEDGCLEATVVCSECDEGRTYVTGLCVGQGSFDSGKFHNHCGKCPGFGICIGDYRNAHCDNCGEHPFVGSMGQFGCDNCWNSDYDDDSEDADDDSEDADDDSEDADDDDDE